LDEKGDLKPNMKLLTIFQRYTRAYIKQCFSHNRWKD